MQGRTEGARQGPTGPKRYSQAHEEDSQQQEWDQHDCDHFTGGSSGPSSGSSDLSPAGREEKLCRACGPESASPECIVFTMEGTP
ncbi:hypothetical protein MUG91_G353n2 [Manis pentadactyla]|nr:hypothetical protein MUG91_G353n2 [Manis pentadactyla]